MPALLHDFSCAVGVELTPQNSPRLTVLAERVGADTAAQTGKAKDFYQRERPFVMDHGQICQPASQLYDERRHRMSYDYHLGLDIGADPVGPRARSRLRRQLIHLRGA